MKNTITTSVFTFLLFWSFNVILAVEDGSSSLLVMPDPPIVENVDVCAGEPTIVTPMPAVGNGGATTIYSEAFDTDGEGVSGSCATGTCATDVPPANGQWTITGNLSGLTATTDFAITNNGQLVFQDTDTEVCYTSSTIDISGCSNVEFSIDIAQSGMLEASDYVDVTLIVDGVPMPISNWNGLGNANHTLVDDFGSTTVTQAITSGSTLVINVCVLNTAGTEQALLDNINVSCSSPGSVVFKYYNDDPANGSAVLLAGPTTGGYDAMGFPGPNNPVWVTACDASGESTAVMVEILVADQVFFSPLYTEFYCEGDEIEVVDFGAVAGEVYTFYDDENKSNVVSIGTYTPGPLPGNYLVYVTLTIDGCESYPDPVSVFIEEMPDPPMISNETYCLGDPIPPVEVIMGQFYSDPTLLNSIGFDSYQPTGMLGTETFYVTEFFTLCESEPTQVNITVEQCIITMVTASNIVTCDPAETEIFPTSNTGSTIGFSFYDGDPTLPTTNLLSGPVQSYVTGTAPGTVDQIWIVANDSNGSESEATMITVEVVLTPDPPLLNISTEFCVGDMIPSISGPYNFYSDASLTTLIAQNSYTPSSAIPGIQNLFITEVNSSNGVTCESDPTPVLFSIVAPGLSPMLMDITVCEGESTLVTPVASMSGGGPSVLYTETFDTDGEGVAGSCASGTCATNVPPANGKWSITGDFTGMTAASDFAITSGGMLEFQDTDTEVCFTSNLIDISTCGTSDFMVGISEAGNLEAFDYVDVNLIVDGISNPIINWMGMGDASHTLIDDFTSTIVTQSGIVGSTMLVEICVLNNSGGEQFFIDNVMVGCESAGNGGTTTFKYYDMDPAAGAMPIVGPTVDPYDPMTMPGTMDMLWVTSCNGPCESEATKVTITVNPIPLVPVASGAEYCEGEMILDIVPIGEAGALLTYYSDATLMTLIQTGASYTPIGTVGMETIYITQTVNGCESDAVEVSITVKPTPIAPVAESPTFCIGDEITDIVATGDAGALFTYYSDAALTSVIQTGPTYTPIGIPGTEIIYVTQTIDDCESPALEIVITIAGFENIVASATCNAEVLDYCIDVSFDFAGPGPSNMYEVIVNGFVFGPFAYGASGSETLTICDPINFIGDEQIGLAIEIADVDRGNVTEGITQTGGGASNPEGCIEISAVMPAQNADNNGDGVVDFCDEFISLTNGGTGILDISGYTISDAITVRHIFPAGTFINPGQIITLFNSDLNQVANCASSGIWNNGSDDIILLDATGLLVDMETYSGSTAGATVDFEVIGCGMGTTISTGPSACLQINSVMANQTADNNGDGVIDFCDEFISITNPGTMPLDISGYTISDGAALRHVFPAGTILAPGQILFVFNSDLSLVTNCSGGGVWNNGGDDIIITDAAGLVVDMENYGGSQAGVESFFSLDECPPLTTDPAGICSGIIEFDEPNCCPIIEVSSFMGMSICAGSCPAPGQGLMASADCGAIAAMSETKWYSDPAGLLLVFEGQIFDPISEGILDNTQAGEYTYYAQVSCSFCTSELIPVTVDIFDCNPPNDACGGCTYFVQLYDTAFDGWDGARFLISINDGAFVEYKPTTADGGILSIPIEMIDGGTIDYMYMEGSNNEQHSFKILDALGNIIATEGMAFTDANIEAGLEKTIKVDCPSCCEDASEQFTFVFTAGQDAVEKSWEIRDSDGSRVAFVNAGAYSGVFTGQSISTSLVLDPCESYTIATFSARNNGWEGGTYQIFSDNPERGSFVAPGVYLIAEGPETFTADLLRRFTLPCSLTCPEEQTILADDIDNCLLNSYTASLIEAPICYPNNCHYSPVPVLEVCYPTAIGGLVQGPLGTTSATLPVGSNPVIYKVTYSDGQIRRCTSQVHVISEINPVLACNDFVILPLVFDGVECETVITADMILEAPNPCNAQYFIELTDANGNVLGNVISMDEAGQTLSYSITQIGTGLSSICEGEILVEDKSAPMISCSDYEVNCNHPEALDPFYSHTETFLVSAGELPGNIAGGTASNPSELFLPIPDVGCGPYGEIIQDINVNIELTHNDIEDLTIILMAPNGTSITLMERRTCNNLSSQNINVTFDSEAQVPVFSACNPGIPGLSGTFRPAQPLSLLYDLPYQDFQGDWTILVRDDDDAAFEGIGVGEVISASMEITAGFPFPYLVSDCNLQSVNLISEQIVETDCDQSEWQGSKIIRVWQAEDSFGNTSSCTQTVGLRAPMLSEIDVPTDVELECGTVPSDPELITPDIGGISFFECFEVNDSHQNACDVIITFEDETFTSCGNGYKIFRTWSVLNWCSGSSFDHVQTILVTDTQGPEIAQNEVVVGTNEEACTADVTLVDLEVLDACSSITDISASYMNDGNLTILNLSNGEAITGLPLGITMVTITATDECLNTSEQQVSITVLDDINPTAICNDGLNITLSDTGVGELSALDFDEGSVDNCSDVSVLIRSLGCESDAFAEVAHFSCCDLGMVIVELQVTDAAGNTNICWADLLVEDATAPSITCAADITVDCDEGFHIDDLFVSPTVVDNCNFDIEESEIVEIELPNCGQLLRKTYTATDGSDKSDDVSCTQSITILHTSDFIVQFPDDITFEACPGELDNIPGPIVTEDECEQVGISIVDRIFNQVEGVCYKVERTYTIVNHCIVDDPSAGGFTSLGTPLPIPRTFRDDDGYFQYTQIIKVQDNEAPVISFTAPDPCDFTDDCEGVMTLLATAEDACSSLGALNFSWEIDAFADGSFDIEGTGDDATGVYPYGDHLIKWIVSDGCGNESVLTSPFSVRDCKNPSPTCQAVTTVVMNNGDCVSINAADLLEYAEDNCTERTTAQWKANARARIALSSGALTSSVELCCEDVFLGSIPVEVWVEDEAGNSDFCVVDVTIQDNMGNCADIGFQAARLIGSVKTEMGGVINGVSINVDDQEVGSTNDQGDFNLILDSGQEYRVQPVKNTNAAEGISTFDLVLMTQHVLQIRKLNSPYKLLAADVNLDGTINIFDLVEERQLILFQIENFSQADSWIFVPADYEFQNPDAPFAENVPLYMDVALEEDFDQANFIAIKVGDLDISLTNNPLTNLEQRIFPETLQLEVEDQKLKAGNTYDIDFKAKDFEDIAGFQFTLGFDKEDISVVNLKGKALNMDSGNYGQKLLDKGKLTASFNVMQEAISIEDDEVLFTVSIIAHNDLVLSKALKVIDEYTLAEAYKANDDFIGLDILYTNSDMLFGDKFELYQNVPNPFRETTDIGFYLPEPSQTTLTIYSVSGKILYQVEDLLGSGYHQLRVDAKLLGTSGLLFYTLEAGSYRAERKMIIID